jgi:Nitronate monooxygenase
LERGGNVLPASLDLHRVFINVASHRGHGTARHPTSGPVDPYGRHQWRCVGRCCHPAGGLGFIGGEYGDQTWLTRELKAVGNTRIGIGFISWSLAKQPDLLTLALDREPAAIFLSFGSVRPFSDQIARSSTRLIVQVQDFAQAREALDGGADIVVAQGTEAGGFSGRRATFPLVPTIVDLAGKTPVIAAGGIADGRGLAAALMLGAAGGLCGTAFYASQEALSHPNAKRAAVVASGDETERSSIRRRAWTRLVDAVEPTGIAEHLYEEVVRRSRQTEAEFTTGTGPFSARSRNRRYPHLSGHRRRGHRSGRRNRACRRYPQTHGEGCRAIVA